MKKEIPIHSMLDIVEDYKLYCRNSEVRALDLGKWIADFKPICRPLVPGELAFFMAGTGVGKSLILQSISINCCETSLFFEMELPKTLMFERFMASAHGMECKEVEQSFKQGKYLSVSQCNHIFVVDASRITAQTMKDIIQKQCEKKIGGLPLVVFVDYIGLMASSGKSRYERTSVAAEDLKVLAKETNTIVIAATQVARPPEDDSTSNELDIHSGKDSGSIENSCGLLVGAWRDREEPHKFMWMKILKNTKGKSGDCFKCNLDGARMRITALSRSQQLGINTENE